MADFERLQAEHQQLLGYAEQNEDKRAVAQTASDYIDRVRAATAAIADPRQRDQLRANLRYWGAFVYEHTGAYPNTTLQPSKAAAVTPRPASRIPWGVILGAIAVVGVTVVGIVLGSVLLISALGMESGAGEENPTPPIVVTTTTQIVEVTAGPDDPTATPPAVTFVRPQLLAQVAVDRTLNCRQRAVRLDARSANVNLANSFIEIYRLGEGESLLFENFDRAGNATLELSDFGTTDPSSFLVRVVDPSLATVDTIVQFNSECTRNTQTITYTFENAPSNIAEERRPTSLFFDWRLTSWGPSPFGDTWVAQIELIANGGDGRFLFWANGEQLEGNTFTITGAPCEPARVPVGVSSGGEAGLDEIIVLSPLCP